MKILVLSNLYPPHAIGGYEERCRKIIDRLRLRGHDIRVLTSTHGLAGESVDGHIHRLLQVHGFFGHPWLPIHQLFQLEKHNQAVLREELDEFQPDVVHVWNLGGISKALTLQLQTCKRPVVYDVSDHWIARSLKADVWLRWWNGDSGGFAAQIVRALLRVSGLALLIKQQAPFAPWKEIEFRHIYFCSQTLKQITIDKGYDLGHSKVIYCGIETDKFQARPDDERFTRLLYVGRLSEDKDPLTAIRAMKLLPDRFTLSLYGRGDADYLALLQSEARDLGNRVEFKAATPDEMERIYSQYDALLFTSAWEEPFALTPLEAMAGRLPVISTLEGGSRELIRHGENALAFRTGNPEDLAAQVLRMENEPDARHSMVETALHEVRERYDIEAITSQIEETLKASRQP